MQILQIFRKYKMWHKILCFIILLIQNTEDEDNLEYFEIIETNFLKKK